MESYPISEYKLTFDELYSELRVQNDQEEIIQTWDLTDIDPPVHLSVDQGAYFITRENACGECMAMYLDVTGGDKARVEGTIMGGLGILDLRDVGKPVGPKVSVDFYLHNCGVNLYSINPGMNDSFRIKTSRNEGICYETK